MYQRQIILLTLNFFHDWVMHSDDNVKFIQIGGRQLADFDKLLKNCHRRKSSGPKIGVRNTSELYLNLDGEQLHLVIIKCAIRLYMVCLIVTVKIPNKTHTKVVKIYY